MSVRALPRGIPLALFVLAALLSAWCTATAMAAQDPVAAYSFDAGEGTTAEDVTGNEHDGTIAGADWFENGRFGSALDFHGEKGECVTVPDAEDLRITEELTVEAWVRPRSPVSDDPIVFKSAYGYTGDALGIGIFNSGKPEGFIGEGGGEFESVVGPGSLEPNVWTHLALTYDGAHMRLYVNGELVATKAQSEGAPWGEGPLVIGCNPNYTSEVFDGLIDEVRVYNRALPITPDSIKDMNQLPICGSGSDGGAGAVAERESLPDGGYLLTYHLRGADTIEIPHTPAGFEPLSASDAELSEYGMPPRPTEPEALEEWEEDMAGKVSVPTGPNEVCQAQEEEPTLQPTAESAEAETDSEGDYHRASNWAGYVALDFAHPSRFVAVSGNFIQPAELNDQCTGSKVSSWVGLGGYGQAHGLMQAGITIEPNKELYPWYEWVHESEGIPPKPLRPLIGKVHAGDKVQIYVAYEQSNHLANFYVHDIITGAQKALLVPHFDGDKWYNGATAEWINERGSVGGRPRPLKHFSPVHWSGVRAEEGDGTDARVADLPHRRIVMKRKNGSAMAIPSALSESGKQFTTTWKRCSP